MRGQICPTAPSFQPEVPVINPRYEGATPEMMERALLRHKPAGKPSDGDDGDDDAPDAARQSFGQAYHP